MDRFELEDLNEVNLSSLREGKICLKSNDGVVNIH